MRQIKVKRLRPMNCFAKAPYEFANDDFVDEPGLKKNSADHPQKKDAQRSNPWPPTGPGADAALERRARRSRPTSTPLKQRNARQQKRVNNRTLDQHRGREQCKDVNSISRFPFLLPLDFPPDQ